MSRWPPGVLRWALVPVALGLVAGGLLELTLPGSRMYLTAAPGLVALVAGLLAGAGAAVAALTRRRTAASERAGRAGAEAAAMRDRQRFLARLDHELKNPLTAIRAALANIDLNGAAPGSADAVVSAAAQADRIARLAGDLRKLAELENQQLETAAVDLPGLLREVAEAAGELPGAGERSIRLTVPEAPWPLPRLDGDRDLLFIALQNLVANAVKFTGPGDTVELRASENGAAVLIEVADTGTGIPDAEIGQVWQELARGSQARSLPGTGIGLALVRVIVTRHGGDVAIRSREGQGTVVSVRLPVTGRRGAAPDVAIPRHPRDAPGTAPV
jgi:two-component system, OmpR family, sensor kinase